MNKSLFEQLGGKPAVNVAVEIFYTKVLQDSELKPFFKSTDMKKQRAVQKAFLTFAFGGSDFFNGRNMRDAHQKAVNEGLNEHHFNLVVGHLATSLKELGVKDELILQVANVANSIKDDVLCR